MLRVRQGADKPCSIVSGRNHKLNWGYITCLWFRLGVSLQCLVWTGGLPALLWVRQRADKPCSGLEVDKPRSRQRVFDKSSRVKKETTKFLGRAP